MIIYRPHAGTLEDAMRQKMEFHDFDEMKSYIVDQWTHSCFGRSPFDVDDIIIENESVDDHRNGWHDTRHVCVSRFGDCNYLALFGAPQCIGWCATDYEK